MAHNSAPHWQSFQFRFASLPRLAQSRTVELTDIGQCCLCHFLRKSNLFFHMFSCMFFWNRKQPSFFLMPQKSRSKWSLNTWFDFGSDQKVYDFALHIISDPSPWASKNAVARTRVVVLIHDHSWCSIKSKTNQKLYDTNGQHNGRFSLYKINKKKMSQDKPPPKRTSEYKIPSL